MGPHAVSADAARDPSTALPPVASLRMTAWRTPPVACSGWQPAVSSSTPAPPTSTPLIPFSSSFSDNSQSDFRLDGSPEHIDLQIRGALAAVDLPDPALAAHQRALQHDDPVALDHALGHAHRPMPLLGVALWHQHRPDDCYSGKCG